MLAFESTMTGSLYTFTVSNKNCYFINMQEPKRSVWSVPLRAIQRCEVEQGGLVICLSRSSSANLLEAATTFGSSRNEALTNARCSHCWSIIQERDPTSESCP